MSTFIHDEKKFFFIHVPKTGGTTISKYFRSQVGRDWKEKYSPNNANLAIHAGVKAVYRQIGAEMDNYFSFAFYRNSWDRYYSLYRYIHKTEKHPLYNITHKSSFDDWLYLEEVKKIPKQTDLLLLKNSPAVSKLADFRDFGTEFNLILDKLGYEQKDYQSYNVDDNKKDYRNVYNKETEKRVQSICEEEIEYFKFKF